MEFTNQELAYIHRQVSQQDALACRVRGLLELCLHDKSIPHEIVSTSPYFLSYLKQNKEIITQILEQRQRLTQTLPGRNRVILKKAFAELTKMSKQSTLQIPLFHKQINIACLMEGELAEKGFTLTDLNAFIAEIFQDKPNQATIIQHFIRKHLLKAGIYDKLGRIYFLSFFLSSSKELVGVVAMDPEEAKGMQGIDFLLTRDYLTILNFLETYGYRRKKDTIEEALSPGCVDEYLDDDNDYDDDYEDEDY